MPDHRSQSAHALTAPDRESRALPRRRVRLGEGLTFELDCRAGRLDAEAIDVTPAGLGLALLRADAMPALAEVVGVRCTGRGGPGVLLRARVRHIGRLRSAGRVLPRVGLALLPGAARVAGAERRRGERHACADALPAYAAADSPWFFGERMRFRVRAIAPGGLTLAALQTPPALLAGTHLDLDLQLPFAGALQARARVSAVRGAEIGVALLDPPRALLDALAVHLLGGDAALTPARLRAAGMAVGSIAPVVEFGCADGAGEIDEILALRLSAHQAEGHLDGTRIADLRSPYDAHARHLVCRFGGRIVGYVRVIFVAGVAARSQYVSLGGHDVPGWLWDAGFAEAGAGAMNPDFQRAGLFAPLMQHSVRVAVQAGERYVLGACDDGLLAMYAAMGFEVLEQRIVEPKRGWRFRSHLIVLDTQRLLDTAPATRALAGMAAAIAFGRRY